MDNGLFDKINNFDFSTGERLSVSTDYNLSEPDYIEKMDNDSADAWSMVRKHDLSFDVTSHYSTEVVDGVREFALVVVDWTFWKDNG